MDKKLDVEFRQVGLSLKVDDATGPGTSGQRRYRVRIRTRPGEAALSYLLTLRELSTLHMALTQELFRRRAELSRRSDSVLDPYRQEQR